MKIIKINAVKLDGPNIILARYENDYIMKTSDGIIIYTKEEMKEVFNLTETDLVSIGDNLTY